MTAFAVWTVPVMLFPAGGLALWFVLSALRGDTSEPRADLARFALAVPATAVLTLLLYAPIITTVDGAVALTGNSFVRASSWRVFFIQISSSVKPVFASWTLGYPVAISIILGAFAIAGLVFGRAAISYGPALLMNEIGADGRIAGPIIFVADLGDHNEVLRARFADRPWYRLEVPIQEQLPQLVPYK